MKQQTEKMADKAVRELLQTLRRNHSDTGTVLDRYEETHSEAEMAKSRHYMALALAYGSMGDAIERMERELEMKQEPKNDNKR